MSEIIDFPSKKQEYEQSQPRCDIEYILGDNGVIDLDSIFYSTTLATTDKSEVTATVKRAIEQAQDAGDFTDYLQNLANERGISFSWHSNGQTTVIRPQTSQQAIADHVRSHIAAEIVDPEVREVLNRALRPPVICFQLPQKETYTPEEAALVAQMISLSLLNL